jgi:hypothetical protein
VLRSEYSYEHFDIRNNINNISITGGTVYASGGRYGAGIGGGRGRSEINITIDGNADITAIGGFRGAGIGSGYNGNVESITISNGTVTAFGNYLSAGIGGGSNGSGGIITITNGNIKVSSGDDEIPAIGSGSGGRESVVSVSVEYEPASIPRDSIDVHNLLEILSGLWVDVRYYESETIDEAVIFPFAVGFENGGIDVYLSINGRRPLEPRTWAGTGGAAHSLPASINYLENGLVELLFDTTKPVLESGLSWADPVNDDLSWSEWDLRYANHKIIVDVSSPIINKIIYHSDDAVYEMVRYDASRDPSRYLAEKFEDGIRILFHVGAYGFPPRNNPHLRIYRSEIKDEKGIMIHEEQLAYSGERNRSFYEFIDGNIEQGKIYYYSLWIYNNWWGDWNEYKEDDNPIKIGGEWQMMVDINKIWSLSNDFEVINHP